MLTGTELCQDREEALRDSGDLAFEAWAMAAWLIRLDRRDCTGAMFAFLAGIQHNLYSVSEQPLRLGYNLLHQGS